MKYEFEWFAVVAWKYGTHENRLYLGETRFLDFPDDKARQEVAKKYNADYLTIEKRYEYDGLPFEGE